LADASEYNCLFLYSEIERTHFPQHYGARSLSQSKIILPNTSSFTELLSTFFPMLIHYPITPKRPPLHPQHPNSSFSACSETFRINNYLSSPIHIHKAPEHLIYLLTLPPPFISRNSSSTFLYEYMTYISPMVSSIPHGPLALTILRRPMRESR